jgi:two-component sensor histidine kinase
MNVRHFRSRAEFERGPPSKKNFCLELRLREALAREQALVRQHIDLIDRQKILNCEADHRILNGLQIIVSLLSLQSRSSANAEAASQLAIAANRVGAIARLHRRLRYMDGVQTVEFKQYLEDICRDFGMVLGAEGRRDLVISVEAIEIMLPTKTGIPLGFIVNELLTNAAKYGTGRIVVRLQPNPGNGFALSVSNDGPALPETFDPVAQQGLGMGIIRSFVESISGYLRISRGDENKGARFTVLFT